MLPDSPPVLLQTADYCVDSLPCNLLIHIHTALSPPDAGYEVITREIMAQGGQVNDSRALVFTDGGGPTHAQRARMKTDFPHGTPSRIAIISDSAVIRFVVSSLAMLGIGSTAVFPPRHLAKALQFLDCTAQERVDIHAWMARAKVTVPHRFTTFHLAQQAVEASPQT